MAFDVDASLFQAAALFQSTEETRYYLMGVCIEEHPEGGVFIVATDGHRMLVCHDASGNVSGGPLIVQLGKDQLRACKAGRGEVAARRVKSSGGKAPAFVTDADGREMAVAHGWQIEASFPDWRRAMSGANSMGGHDGFDASLFASFSTAAKIVGDTTKIHLETSHDHGPALIRFANVSHVVGLIMPLRWTSEKGFPLFLGFEPNMPVAAEEGAEAA